MSDRIRCNCRRCTIRGLMGPTIVVTVGVLFLLAELRGGYFEFWRTWPVILIVIGVVNLATSFASQEGHLSAQPPAPPIAPSTPVAPPSGATPNPYEGQGQ